ncbi:MAG: glycosyltransferase [Anaerolineales bacterium]|nr:glycosyltransferase [Anaerolineales bacterium]
MKPYPSNKLRVAIVAGTLGYGGAEKQLVYLAKALAQLRIDVRVYCLTRGEPYEGVLYKEGIPLIWFGKPTQPILRVINLIKLLRDFRPHFIQSTHFYANLYVALASRLVGGVSIGSLRSDLEYELGGNGFWGPWLLRSPQVILSNSHLARQRAIIHGLNPARVFVLPNVIDLHAFDRQSSQPFPYRFHEGQIGIATVSRLIEAKRLDRFLRILSRVRQHFPMLKGIIAGDGPLRQHLEQQATMLGLIPDGVEFLGHCETVAALLSRMDIYGLTSDHEGFPNSLLEAMAASLPVITTPAGDAARIVQDGINGFVIRKEDEDSFVERLIWLVQHPQPRRTMGAMGRQIVAKSYSTINLGNNILDLYHQIAISLNLPEVATLAKA